MAPSIIIVPIFLGIFAVAAIVGIGIFVSKVNKESREREAKRQDRVVESYRAHSGSSSSSKTTMSIEQRRRLDELREHYKQLSEQDKHERHVEDAHEHNHSGEEEHYEEIVGSLGEINDEGCADLSGVRFIAHDLSYDASDGQQHDHAELVKAMVLGEILNSPRFKGLKRP